MNGINRFLNETLPLFSEKALPLCQPKTIVFVALAAITCYAIKVKLDEMISIASQYNISIRKDPLGFGLLFVASFFMTSDPFVFGYVF